MGIVYVPFMQGVFQTVGLAGNDLGFVMVIAGIGFVLHEGRRRYERSVNADLVFASVMEEMA